MPEAGSGRAPAGSNDQTFQHDKANQISTEGGSGVSHDQAGNYTATSNALRYTWTNQLGVYIKAGSPAVTHTWHFDALGRKIEWTDGTREHHFYYDGQQIVEAAEMVSGSEVGRKLNVWGERIDDLVLYEWQFPNPDVAYWAHQDHLGSVALLVESDGDVAEGYRYVEWGQTTIVDGSFAKLTVTEGDTRNNVRYTGRDQYTALGDNVDTWYNYRARALRTKWGRFLERDPIDRQHLTNDYAYVANSPLNLTDPSGRVTVQLPTNSFAGTTSSKGLSPGTIQTGGSVPPSGPVMPGTTVGWSGFKCPPVTCKTGTIQEPDCYCSFDFTAVVVGTAPGGCVSSVIAVVCVPDSTDPGCPVVAACAADKFPEPIKSFCAQHGLGYVTSKHCVYTIQSKCPGEPVHQFKKTCNACTAVDATFGIGRLPCQGAR